MCCFFLCVFFFFFANVFNTAIHTGSLGQSVVREIMQTSKRFSGATLTQRIVRRYDIVFWYHGMRVSKIFGCSVDVLSTTMVTSGRPNSVKVKITQISMLLSCNPYARNY